ncbi:6138_t:CDS:2 [Entrophospora sp. SA101]|nr:437_t:CDS:2 [Entrophospora sp. SA101]CAJ0876868.1 6138_t:CDS:2 [Entrophospora sp. SA101]
MNKQQVFLPQLNHDAITNDDQKNHTYLTQYKFNNNVVNLRQFSNSCIRKDEATVNSIKVKANTDPNVSTKETYESIKEKIIKDIMLDNDAIKLMTSEKNPELKNAEAWNQLIIEYEKTFNTSNSRSIYSNFKKSIIISLFINNKISQRVKKFNFALETYDNFIRSGKLKPNADTCLQILKTCSANCTRQPKKAYEMATDVWNKFVKNDQQQGKENANNSMMVDNELINHLITVFKFTDHTQEAFDIVDEFYGIGKSAIINSSESTKDDSLKLPITNDIMYSIFSLCFKTKQLGLGIKYYNQIMTKYPDFSLDINNYNSLISLYNLNYQFNQTLGTYHDQFKKFNLIQNNNTFESLIFACQNLRDLNTAKEILENAVENQMILKSTSLTKILRLVLEQARTTDNYDDVCWLLEKVDKTGDIDFNKEKKGIILINDMNDKQLLHGLSSAYEIALQEVKDLSKEKRAQWAEDKKFFDHKADRLNESISKSFSRQQNNIYIDNLRIKKTYQGRQNTQNDKSWYDDPDENISKQFPNLNHRYNRYYSPKSSSYMGNSAPIYYNLDEGFSHPPPQYQKSYYSEGYYSAPMYYNPNESFSHSSPQYQKPYYGEGFYSSRSSSSYMRMHYNTHEGFRHPPPPSSPSELSSSPISDYPPSRIPRQPYGSFRRKYNRRPSGYYRPPRINRNSEYHGPTHNNN